MPILTKPEKKDKDLLIENLDLNTDSDAIDDDSVLIEDEAEIDPTTDVDIQPTEEDKEEI